MAKLLLLAWLAILPLTMVHGQGTPLLFLGPDAYSSGKSEVWSLPTQGGDLTPAACTVPPYPIPDISHSAAFVKDGYLQLCGGYSDSSSPKRLFSCYVLRDSAWVATTPLTSARGGSAAITLQDGSVLISGGFDGTRLSSSEMLTGTTWSPALELPSPRLYHCLIALSTGEIFLHGGVTRSDTTSDTHISTDLRSWQTKSSSAIARQSHACTEVTLGTEQEVWVGGAGTTEIYSVATDTWRTGPSLPHTREYPGEFTSDNGQLYYSEGRDHKGIYRLKAGWTPEDAWEKIGGMSRNGYWYQALIISQDICEGLGEETKRTPVELTYTPDGGVAYVSGSLVPVITQLASASAEPLSVSCCGGPTTTTTTCGNGTSCTNICGGNSSGCLTLVLEDSAAAGQVCDASMQQHQWCANPDIIQELTSVCNSEQSTRTIRAVGFATPMFRLNYCVFRVRSVGSIKKYPECCLHWYTRSRIAGVPLACCRDHMACY